MHLRVSQLLLPVRELQHTKGHAMLHGMTEMV